MDSLPAAGSLARGLLVLARSGQSGVLTVRAATHLARVGVRAGRVIAMRVLPDDGDSLGRALRAMDAWDADAADGAPPPMPEEALGAWAVRVGAAKAEAVSHALRKQLQRRIVRLFALDPPELRLSPGSSDVGAPALSEPPHTAALIVGALRDRVADEPLLLVRRRLGDGVLVLTPLGRELLEGAVLWPDEAAMRPLLERGASVYDCLEAARGSPRAQRLLHALVVVGACAAPAPRSGYATLLRKTRQVRRRAGGAELLELERGARPEAARRALRRIASTVHPDRFGETAPAGIRAASHEVMSALVRAQGDVS